MQKITFKQWAEQGRDPDAWYIYADQYNAWWRGEKERELLQRWDGGGMVHGSTLYGWIKGAGLHVPPSVAAFLLHDKTEASKSELHGVGLNRRLLKAVKELIDKLPA